MGETPEPSQMRISDADRQRVAEVLRDAAGEGRIDLDELDERLDATWSAKTYADLVPLTVDLPAAGHTPIPAPRAQSPRPAVPAVRHDSTLSIVGGASRKGVWEVGPTHNAFAMMAGIDLDLRQARFTARETVIYANAFWAGIDILVNEYTHVVVDGVGVMGSFDHAADKVAAQLGPDSPVVRVKGVALMGAVTVRRKAMPDPRQTWRKRMLGH